MQAESQTTEDLLGRLSRLEVEWQDALSHKAIDRLENLERKSEYGPEDIKNLLSHDFDSGSLVVRLFLGLSKDAFEAEKAALLGKGNAGKISIEKNLMNTLMR